MIRGMFRATADQQVLAELRSSSQFRKYVDKLRTAHTKALADVLYSTPQDLPVKQGYLRCLSELLEELEPTGV